MAKHDVFEIEAVMDQTGCDMETAVRALDWSDGRVSLAVNRVLTDQKYEVQNQC